MLFKWCTVAMLFKHACLSRDTTSSKNFLTDNPPPLKIDDPVLSQWGYVNVACTHLYDHCDQWKQFAEGLPASTTAARYMGILASNLLSLMKEVKLYWTFALLFIFPRSFSNQI
jgi:hypothetical protein